MSEIQSSSSQSDHSYQNNDNESLEYTGLEYSVDEIKEKEDGSKTENIQPDIKVEKVDAKNDSIDPIICCNCNHLINNNLNTRELVSLNSNERSLHNTYDNNEVKLKQNSLDDDKSSNTLKENHQKLETYSEDGEEFVLLQNTVNGDTPSHRLATIEKILEFVEQNKSIILKDQGWLKSPTDKTDESLQVDPHEKILSAHSELINLYPICNHCDRSLTQLLEQQLKNIISKNEMYSGFLVKLKEENESSKFIISESEIQAAKEKEIRAKNQLDILKEEQSELDNELEAIKKELENLDKVNKDYWESVNHLQIVIDECLEDDDTIKQESEHVTAQLSKLKKTNVYNDAFRIWHDGPFGTINGFRLGRLSDNRVDNEEINTALGFSVLLLNTISTKLEFSFQGYRLIPCGNTSAIEVLNTQGKGTRVYNLHLKNKMILMTNLKSDFQPALQGFIACVEQLGEYAEKCDPTFRLPYRIVNGAIDNIFVHELNISKDSSSQILSTWTKAMKYVLIDLKWLLAFCCSKLGN